MNNQPYVKPKLLVISTAHYRGSDGKVKSIDCRIGRNIESKDDPIIRTVEIGEDWTPLESAWIKDIGYLFLRNDGGIKFNVVPTEEQINEAQSRVVEIGYHVCGSTIVPVSLWQIHVGECFQGKPIAGNDILLRCQHGKTNVTMMIHPN